MRDKKMTLKNYTHFNGTDGTLLEMTSMNTLEVLIDIRDILAKPSKEKVPIQGNLVKS